MDTRNSLGDQGDADPDSRSPEERVRQTLERGGLSLSSPATTRFEPTLDPQGAEWLVHRLADKVSGSVDQFVAWDEPEDLVLAHLLGLALGLTWIRCSTDGTDLSLSRLPHQGSRVGLVSDYLRPSIPVALIGAALGRAGGSLVVLCALVADSRSGEALGLQQVSLITVERS